MDREPAPLPEAEELRFPGSSQSWSLYRFAELDSTSDFLHQRAGSMPDRSVVTAKAQKAGRGRMGRAWMSPPGGLYASMLLRPCPPLDLASRLGLLIADLICDMLSESRIPGQVKWPNDVVVGDRKLAGILPECGNHPSPWMIVGLGMNVASLPGLPDARGLTPAHWGGFGHPPGTIEILRDLLARLDAAWPHRSIDPLRGRLDSLATRLWCRGQLVRIVRGPETATGTVSGIDPEGHLMIATSSGMRAFDSGELRPV
jgi:BirA family biotin operon repressor/biotin-[acetyl-CoA-carboxylase] ligase